MILAKNAESAKVESTAKHMNLAKIAEDAKGESTAILGVKKVFLASSAFFAREIYFYGQCGLVFSQKQGISLKGLTTKR